MRRGKKDKKKLFSSAEPKAAPLTMRVLLCYRTKWKGQEGRATPAQRERKLKGLQTLSLQYIQGVLKVSTTDTKHTEILKNKQEQRQALDSTPQEPERA